MSDFARVIKLAREQNVATWPQMAHRLCSINYTWAKYNIYATFAPCLWFLRQALNQTGRRKNMHDNSVDSHSV